MQHFVSDLVSPAVAARVGRVWGYGSGAHLDPGPWEGELRNMWRPTAQPGLWFSGGNLAQARHCTPAWWLYSSRRATTASLRRYTQSDRARLIIGCPFFFLAVVVVLGIGSLLS